MVRLGEATLIIEDKLIRKIKKKIRKISKALKEEKKTISEQSQDELEPIIPTQINSPMSDE